MRVSKGQTPEGLSDRVNTALAKVLAPEEICIGDYVSLLNMSWELPSYMWCADANLLSPHELVRLEIKPRTSGIPMKVKSVCLPFVLAKFPAGEKRAIDIRCYRLAKLNRAYAKAAWKAYKKQKLKE